MVLMAGVFLVLGAFLGVASWVQYISRSVVAGYITAAAMFIIVNQLQPVFGFKLATADSSNFFLLLGHSILQLRESHWPTVLLSIGCALFYFGLKRYAPRLPAVAVSLVVFSAIGSGLDRWLWSPEAKNLRYLDALDLSSLRLALPPFHSDWISQVAGMAMVLAFLSILEGASIGKSLASRSGEKLNLNQEIFSMGIANIACSLTRGMPASGSLTRSQLNWSSGAKTSFASLFCGSILLIGAWMVGPLTAWVPPNVLGVLVVVIGLSLINRHVLKVVWSSTRSDRIVLLTTFLAALLVRLDFAIIMGTTVSILLFLRKAAQPELVEYAPGQDGHWQPATHASGEPIPEISIIHVEGDLFFGAAELFQDQMRRTIQNPNLKVVILKLRNAHHLDATSILALEELSRTMREENRYLLICELREESSRIILKSGLQGQIGPQNIFADEPANSTLSVAKAVRRARELIGNREADVRIFLGGSKRETQK
jgi:SulP family sulfate permease